MSDRLDFLLDPPTGITNSFRWATVTSVSPLRIRLDGESEPLATSPAALAAVQPGNRVWVQLYGRQVVILGRAVTQ